MARIEIGDPPYSEVHVLDAVDPADLLPDAPRRRMAAFIVQPAVVELAERLAAGLAVDAVTRIVPDRDAAKTLAVAGELYEWLAGAGVSRHDTIVSVGGGAATDLGGFVAGTYLRGIEAVHVPTTLLGAVDAAIGGKTAVNVAGKNLVGVFWHPSRVVIALDVLGALPEDLLREGASEAVKCGFIADAAILRMYERDGLDADLGEVVRRAVAVKAQVVTTDEREAGVRAHLNYGHTVGHAVEYAAGIPHGHAVAIGMVAAAAAGAHSIGHDDVAAHRRLLERLGLPTVAPPVDADAVWRFLGRDKKRDERGLRMTLLDGPQQPVVKHVDRATVRAALDAVGIG